MIIYTSPDLPMVGHIKNILELHGIASTIQKQFSSAAVGYIPPIECWPELWIVDKTQLKQAKRIVKEALKPVEQDLARWKCPNCNESIEGQFIECWNCRTDRP